MSEIKSNIKTILETQKRIISFEEFKKKVQIKDNAVSLEDAYLKFKKTSEDKFSKTILHPDNRFKCVLEWTGTDFIWEDGVWIGGYWQDGTWKNGIWEYGTWEGGTWEGGTWKNGWWYGGTWYGGTWEYGYWQDGTWEDGFWEIGTWKGGTWEGGTWKNGWWYGGTWYGGTWEYGTWYGGQVYLPELKDYFPVPEDYPPTEKNIRLLTSYYKVKRDES